MNTRRLLSMALVAAIAGSAAAAEWSSWERKMKITFRGYTRKEALKNFPALVVFSRDLPGFAYTDFASPENGGDLRFADDQGEELRYEIERWNDTNGQSWVWVRVPEIWGTNTSIRAYWGNPAVTGTPAYAVNGSTWADGYRAVWHMDEQNVEDSTSNEFHGTANGNTDVDALIGGGQEFLTPDYVRCSSFTSPTNAFTFSLWLNAVDNIQGTIMYGVKLPEMVRPALDAPHPGRDDIGVHVGLYVSILEAKPGAEKQRERRGGGPRRAAKPKVTYDSWSTVTSHWADETWYHFAFAWDGNEYRVFVNGESENSGICAGTHLPQTGIDIGHMGGGGYQGFIDEFRVSSVARSPDWIWAACMNQASNSLFNLYEPAELSGPVTSIIFE